VVERIRHGTRHQIVVPFETGQLPERTDPDADPREIESGHHVRHAF